MPGSSRKASICITFDCPLRHYHPRECVYQTTKWTNIIVDACKQLGFQGGTSFVDLLCFCSVLCLLCLCARLFICALWSPAGKGLTSWLSFVVSNCEFVTFPLVSWVGCGT